VADLLGDPERRTRMEKQARATAERLYGWDAIGQRQRRLYQRLTE
jgi:glycosyltransferase involved in cell wall biosynthesis